MRRYGPLDPCVWVSGIDPEWSNATARWVLSGTSPRLIRVVTSGLRVALGWVCLVADAERFRFYINGRPTSTAAAVQAGVATVSGTTYWLTITLPENLQGEDRTVEILMTGAQGLIGVNLEPGTEKAVIHPARKLGLVTDSFGGGGGTAAVDSMATLAALQLGCDFHAEVEGGSGFIQAGSNGLTFGAASKVTRMGTFAPQTLIYLSGVNDDPGAAGYAAAISATMSAYAAACPGVRQVAIGPMPTASASTIGGTWRPLQTAAIKAAVVAAGGHYIDTTGLDEAGGVPTAYAAGTTYTAGQYVTHVGAIWRATGTGIVGRAPGTLGSTGSPWSQVGVIKLNGTGRVGATTGDGNRDTLLLGDGTHYSYPAGHVYSAVEIAAALRTRRHVLPSSGAVVPRAGEASATDVLRALSSDNSRASAVRAALGLGPVAVMTLDEARISIRQQLNFRYDAPYLRAPSGSFSDVSGAFALSTALTVVPNGTTPGGGNCWVYLPAGAGGLTAGWREAFFVSTSAGYLIGLPTTTATAWTGASGIIPLPPLTIAGNALGPNGRADALIISCNNNSAGTKSIRAGAGGPTTGLFVTQNTVASGARVSPVLVNRGAVNKQVPGVDSGFVGVGTVPPYFAIDTSAPWTITASLQCAVATDWAMIDYAAVTCTYIE